MAAAMATTAKKLTRSDTRHSVFGQPSLLQSCQLPTKGELYKCYLWYRNTQEEEGKEPSTRDIAKQVASEVLGVWNKAGIPTIDFSNVVQSVGRLIDSGKELQKYPPAKRTCQSFQTKLSGFDELFDICPCKCVKKISDRRLCSCSIKVPDIEWDFWVDQNSVRKMIIGAVDAKVTAKLQKREERKLKEARFRQQCSQKSLAATSSTTIDADDLSADDQDWEVNASGSTSSSDDDYFTSQNRTEYPNLSEIMERTGLSNRDACKIVNACLQDMKLDKPEYILEPSKLRRQRIYWRNRAVENRTRTLTNLISIGFDGRIDQTRLLEGEGQHSVHKIKKEDHYVVVAYPGELYVDHASPQSGKASDIATEILSIIRETNSVDTLTAVLSDGTNVNTGEHNGVIRQLEVAIKRPVQWLVCMLHLNELPFREVFKRLDAQTAGPRGFKGPIGNALNFDPYSLPIAEFAAIDGNTHDVTVDIKSDLSEDQSYLLRASLVVQQGKSLSNPVDLKFLAKGSPGTLNHARWLTCANRILRLYMATDKPSDELVKLVTFIVRVYAPSWFHIKSHPHCVDGARNFFSIIDKSRSLGDSILCESVQTSLERNKYCAHPESILLAGLTDNDIAVRRDAANKIITARVGSQIDADVRKFSNANVVVDFGSTSYYNMIDWNTSVVTPPPLANSLSAEDLLQQVEVGPISFPQIPCHTQAVERAIKEVTRASWKVFGHSSRHGMIVSSEESRRSHKKA